MIRRPDHVEVVFHDEHARARVDHLVQAIEQHRDVGGMEPRRGLVEDVERAGRVLDQRLTESKALMLTARERRERLAERAGSRARRAPAAPAAPDDLAVLGEDFASPPRDS